MSGKYEKTWEDWDADHPNFSLPFPTTIPELLAYSSPSGTHSALDIDADCIEPFPSETLLLLFDTERPTRAIIDAQAKRKLFANDPYIGYGFGNYIVIYKHDVPSEILFAGATGD